jgi:competence protein ComEA
MKKISAMRSVMTALACGLALAAAQAGPVNINTANAETLAAELTGIGLSKARAIVAYRTRNGAFESLDQLTAVKGIGARILEQNRGLILLSDDTGQDGDTAAAESAPGD